VSRPVVAFVDHIADLGGGEWSMLEVAAHLGHLQVVVLLGADGPLAARLRTAGIGVEVVPLDPDVASIRRRAGIRTAVPAAGLVSWGLRLRRRLDELGAAVVVANTLKAGIALSAARPRARFVWWVHDRIAADYLGRGALLAVRAALAAGPELVVANSMATAATCRRLRHPAIVIPPSVTPPVVRAGGPGEPFRVAVVGRLAPWKGQHHAVAAFDRAFGGAGGSGDEELVLVGGPLFGEERYEQRLRRQAEVIGGRVRFAGHVDDVGPALDGVHVVVHCSRLPEPFGRVVVEAMGAGLPVVAMAAGGPAEVVTDGVDGLLVDPADEGALSDALRRLAGDAALRARLGAAGPVTAARFRPERLAERWHEVLVGADRRRVIVR